MDFLDNCDGDSTHRRSKNFTDKEVDLLLNLIAQHIDVIECKKTDKVTLSGKEAVWKLIEQEFNDNSTGIYRDVKHLKGKYDNVKKISKKKWVESKEILSSGGGPSTSASDNLNETDYKIKEMLGSAVQNGTKSVYDSDVILISLRAEKKADSGLALNCQSSLSQDSNSETKLENGDCLSLNEEHSNQTPSEVAPQAMSPLTREKLSRFSNKLSVGLYKGRSRTSGPSISNKMQKNAFNKRKNKEAFQYKDELLNLKKRVLEEQIRLQREDHKLKMLCTQKEHEEKMKLLKLRIRNEELILQTRLVEIQHITRR